MKFFQAIVTVVVLLGAAVPAAAQSFDPTLHQKAQDYTDWLIEWHSTGLGGVSDIVFTDETRTEIYRTWGAGDSEDWTATYLVTQAIRYLVTGETQARDEVLRIASYLHVVKDITGDPGYIARYAAPNEAPWNVEHIGADNLYVGEGEYADDFWLGHESRDKYITWFWGLAWAYEAVDDAAMRQTIRDDFRDVVDTLVSNNWIIVDPWGDTYAAASVGAGIRIPILAQVARVLDDPEYTALFDEEYEKARNTLGLSMFAFFNKYFEYFAFINNYSSVQGLFHAMPDRERFTHFFTTWKNSVRQFSDDGHNPFFDAVHYGACLRDGSCPDAELAAIRDDAYQSLLDMNDAPNWQRAYTCTDLPLDPFSVWADQMLANNPWIENLFGFDIDPVTDDAHEIWDRCWASVLWERSPYHVTCDKPDYPEHVAHGVDYLIGYWLGVWYGILPGGGPYGDDDLTDDDDDTADDDTGDDDVDDDTGDDDADDDTSDDDWHPPADDDDAADDDTTPGDDDDDNDDDDGCGC